MVRMVTEAGLKIFLCAYEYGNLGDFMGYFSGVINSKCRTSEGLK